MTPVGWIFIVAYSCRYRKILDSACIAW